MRARFNKSTSNSRPVLWSAGLLTINLIISGVSPASTEGRTIDATEGFNSQRPFSSVGGINLKILIESPTLSDESTNGLGASGLLAICKKIGRGFLRGQGLWETGFADNFSCYESKRLLFQTGTPDIRHIEISIRISEEDSKLKFEIGHSEKNDLFQPFGDRGITIPIGKWVGRILSDSDFAMLLAFALIDSCPFTRTVRSDQFTKNGFELVILLTGSPTSDIVKFDSPKAPPKIVVYEIDIADNTMAFSAKHICDLGLVDIARRRVKVTSGKQASSQITSVATYRASKPGCYTGSKNRLFSHSMEGPGKGLEARQALVSEAYDRMEAAANSGLFDQFLKNGYASVANLVYLTTASGYSGARMGYQLLQGSNARDKILNQAKMFGLLVEVRAGPLDGLKFYYDVFPQVSSGSRTDNDITLNWSRFVIGKSFYVALPSFINKIEVTPKIGRYYFAAKLPIEFDAAGEIVTSQEFNIKNQPSFSVEIALERSAKSYTTRFWHSVDRAITFLPVVGTSSVAAERFGMDIFLLTGLKFNLSDTHFSTNWLVFSSYENLRISDLGLDDLGPGDIAVSAVNLRSAYAGFGVVLNW